MLKLNFSDRPVVCVASGPSLSDAQVASIRKAHKDGLVYVIAISDNYQRVPEADVIYSTDLKWWGWHYKAVVSKCKGLLVSGDTGAALAYKRLTYIRSDKSAKKFSLGKGIISTGKNSGFAALNLALLWSARQVLLVGYDMRNHLREEDKANGTYGALHWFGNHPGQVSIPYYRGWIEMFEGTKEQVEREGFDIVNCTPLSALTAYRMGDLGTELERFRLERAAKGFVEHLAVNQQDLPGEYVRLVEEHFEELLA